jgi:hypothetical protein
MKGSSRGYLILGLMLAGGFTGLGRSAEVDSPETSPNFTIHVYNHAQVDPKTLMEAEKVATGVFRKAGVESRWIEGALTSEHKQEDSLNPRPFGPTDIQLDLLPLLMAGRFGLPNNVMGLAPGTGPDRRLVYVFYSNVEALARRQSRTHVGTALILGHAMAHEIGHLLLDQQSHSPTGIMRGDWNLKDLQDAVYGYLLFTPKQTEVIQAEVGRRIGRQHAEAAELASPKSAC